MAGTGVCSTYIFCFCDRMPTGVSYRDLVLNARSQAWYQICVDVAVSLHGEDLRELTLPAAKSIQRCYPWLSKVHARAMDNTRHIANVCSPKLGQCSLWACKRTKEHVMLMSQKNDFPESTNCAWLVSSVPGTLGCLHVKSLLRNSNQLQSLPVSLQKRSAGPDQTAAARGIFIYLFIFRGRW